MEFDIVTGDAKTMAQAFPHGTMSGHDMRNCWCRPKYSFEHHGEHLFGMVVHQ